MDPNTPEAIAERQARFKEKQKAGHFQFQAQSSAGSRVALVRDSDGKPKFDIDPKSFPEGIQEAFKEQMSEQEIREYFR